VGRGARPASVIGPWAAGDGATWAAAAGALLDAALAQVPATVTRHEPSGDTAEAWPAGDDDSPAAALRSATAGDVGGIAALHDVEFPGTYASAAQLVAGQTDGTRVVLVAEDRRGGVAGYAARRSATTARGTSTSWPSTRPPATPAWAGGSWSRSAAG
jgi:hypothetical protein